MIKFACFFCLSDKDINLQLREKKKKRKESNFCLVFIFSHFLLYSYQDNNVNVLHKNQHKQMVIVYQVHLKILQVDQLYD
jgi:hypothetical protein